MNNLLLNSTKQFPKAVLAITVLSGTLLGFSATQVVQADAPNYEKYYLAGRSFLNAHDYGKAYIELNQAIRLATTPQEKANAQVALAETFVAAKEYERADTLVQILQKLPETVLPKITTLGLLAQLRGAQGRIEDATTATKQMFESSPEKFPGVKFNPDGTLAQLTMEDLPQLLYGHLIGDVKGKTLEQIQAALEAVTKNPKAPNFDRDQAKVYVGDILLQQGKLSEAREFYLNTDLSLSRPIQQMTVLTKIGNTYAGEKKWLEALKSYDLALSVEIAPAYKRATQLSREFAQRQVKAAGTPQTR